VSLTKRGKHWHYHFYVDGQRYRGSTKQSTKSKAEYFERKLIEQIEASGPLAVPGKAPTLREYSEPFLKWVDNTTDLKDNTRRYYRFGWERLKDTSLADMRLNAITTDAASMVQFAGSAAWGNQARRTLRRMLGHAAKAKIIRTAPAIHLADELGRDGIMDDDAEKRLLAVAKQPLHDVILIMRDTGMRPEEVFRMRWENVSWDKRLYFNPEGKSRKARRWVPLSQRVFDMLKVRATKGGQWVFPSKKKTRTKGGHLTTVAKQFRQARTDAGLPDWLVLYHARHAFGTFVMAQTGNPALVRDAMGHSSLSTTMIYQHPDLDPLRTAIDGRNARAM
jgi:integrase